MEDLDGAMADFSKAVQLNKSFPIAYVQKCYTDFRYAMAKHDLDKVTEAIEGFKNATKEFDQCTEVFSLYAQVPNSIFYLELEVKLISLAGIDGTGEFQRGRGVVQQGLADRPRQCYNLCP